MTRVARPEEAERLVASAELLIVTANFPFMPNGGEVTFIAPEITRLARTLDARIVIAPLHARGDRVPLPDCVEVDTTLSEALRKGWVGNSMRACLWPGFWREVRRALRAGGGGPAGGEEVAGPGTR